LQKVKFNIIIPEIKSVAEIAKPSTLEEGKAAPMAEGGTISSKTEEEKASPLKNGATQKAAAPPVPAFKAPPKPKEDGIPGIDSLYNYKPIF
jgi:hypothetical protein